MIDNKTCFELYLQKLGQLGIDTNKLAETYGDALMNATFTNNGETGLAEDGSLLRTILYKLTPYAIKINEIFPETIRVDKGQLVKICLLHQISKAVRYIKNDNEWEVKNRKLFYKFNPQNPSIRTGLHSLVMAQNCGISFTPEEAEVMTINDRDLSDDQARWHSSLMATIIRQANEMVYLEALNTNKEPKETQE